MYSAAFAPFYTFVTKSKKIKNPVRDFHGLTDLLLKHTVELKQKTQVICGFIAL